MTQSKELASRAAQRMTAGELETRIREGLERCDIRLGHLGYVSGNTCCAIGGALAYAAKDHSELRSIVGEIWKEVNYAIYSDAHRRAFAKNAARLLNHGLRATDMRALESGYENFRWRGSRTNPFYLLGRKLRKESGVT